MNRHTPARLALTVTTIGLLALPTGHHTQAPVLDPARIAHLADSYVIRAEYRCVSTVLDRAWFQNLARSGHETHGRHAENPHIDPPERSPLRPAPPPEYSVTGVSYGSYMFRLPPVGNV